MKLVFSEHDNFNMTFHLIFRSNCESDKTISGDKYNYHSHAFYDVKSILLKVKPLLPYFI